MSQTPVSIHEFLAVSEQHGDTAMRLDLNVFTAMCVVANVQLALRHPANHGPSAEAAQEFVRKMGEHLGTIHPVFAEVIAQGWDPRFDMPGQSRNPAPDRPTPADPWQASEPPKDRTIIIIGCLVGSNEERGYSYPVTCEAHWSADSQTWLGSDGMSIRSYSDERLVIHHWIDLPKTPSDVSMGDVSSDASEEAPAADCDQDTKLGMAWWNGMSVPERNTAMTAAQAALGRISSVSEAWEHWKQTHISAPEVTVPPIFETLEDGSRIAVNPAGGAA